VCVRSRPRSTRVNKRFLARTVASAARSRPSHDLEAVPSTSCASHAVNEETPPRNKRTAVQQQQQRTGVSHHPQRVGKADKRKHSADNSHSDSDSSNDRQQTDAYDVYEYITLNKQYKLEKKTEISTSCSASQTK